MGPHPSPSPGSLSPGVGELGPRQHRSWGRLLRASGIRVGGRVSFLQGNGGWAGSADGRGSVPGSSGKAPTSPSPLMGALQELGSGGSTHRGLPPAGHPEPRLWVHSEPALPSGTSGDALGTPAGWGLASTCRTMGDPSARRPTPGTRSGQAPGAPSRIRAAGGHPHPSCRGCQSRGAEDPGACSVLPDLRPLQAWTGAWGSGQLPSTAD